MQTEFIKIVRRSDNTKNQIGNAFWDAMRKEHLLNEDGAFEEIQATLKIQKIDVFSNMAQTPPDVSIGMRCSFLHVKKGRNNVVDSLCSRKRAFCNQLVAGLATKNM